MRIEVSRIKQWDRLLKLRCYHLQINGERKWKEFVVELHIALVGLITVSFLMGQAPVGKDRVRNASLDKSPASNPNSRREDAGTNRVGP